MSSSFIQEIELLARRGENVSRFEIDGQQYALMRGIEVPRPPWDENHLDIVIALPAADGAALDAFYLRLPFGYNGGQHPRVSGGKICFDGSKWQLVSWHYPDGQPWHECRDTLESHITHCKGFFWQRGAVNAAK